MTALDSMDASAVRRWCLAADAGLVAHQDEIDAINVYPVPDSDTGTNLALTVRAAVEAVQAELSTEAGAVLAAMARGCVLGARGNSGVILAQLMRGLAESAVAAPTWTAARLTLGLRQACEQAYGAVAAPVEGTILSVIRAAADAAAGVAIAGVSRGTDRSEGTDGTDGADLSRVDDLSRVVQAALAGAQAALAATTEQLAELRQANVVDAGGRGLVVILDALAAVVSGRVPTAAPAYRRAGSAPRSDPEIRGARRGYEVQYLLRADDSALPALRRRLSDLGDSLVVAGTGHGQWNVHVHVDDVGAAIEAGVEAGQPSRITVVRFADQFDARTQARSDVRPANGVAIVAVAPGRGLADLFRAEGVHVVERRGPPGGAPAGGAPAGGGPAGDVGAGLSTQDVVDAIRATGAGAVILLSHCAESDASVDADGDASADADADASVDADGDAGARIDAVVEQAAAQARAGGLTVAVVPTRSAVQALAAVAVHDPSRRFEDDVITMAESAASTRWAEVTVARREALTMAGRCQPGDVLGLIGGEVVDIGSDVVSVAGAVIDRLLGVGGELVTVLLGSDAPPGAGAAITEHVAAVAPHAEVAILLGGQPAHPLLIGVE